MRIRPFDPHNDRDVTAWHAVAAPARAHDFPSWPSLAREEVRARTLAPSPPGETVVRWLADDGDSPVGVAALTILAPPNDAAAHLELVVLPERRRQGCGRALLREAVTVAGAHGRTLMHAEAAEDGPGVGFAARVGFRQAQRAPQSVTKLRDADAHWLAHIAGAAHPGYRLARWVSRAPDAHVESFAVARRSMADAPTGDTRWQTPAWDAGKLREDEAIYAACGDGLHIVAALTESGEVAGLTEVVVNEFSPRRAGQEDTLVVPSHRGHGLGLWMKAEMATWLITERPDVVEVATWNAEENRHMRSINEVLGYRVERWWHSMIAELPLTAVDGPNG